MFHIEHAADVCAPTRRTVYSLNFLLTAVVALVTYFNTPLFIERGVPESAVGLVYALSAFATMILLLAAPKIFTRLGNYRALSVLGLTSAVALALLAFAEGAGATIALFTLWASSLALVYLLLDMILEGSMPEEGVTGGSRGLFISMGNAAWFVFPALAGVLAAFGSFSLLYSTAALGALIGLLIARRRLRDIRNHTYLPIRITRVFSMLRLNRDLRLVFSAQFLLRIFFAIMVIYTPIYLLGEGGMTLENLGAIISIAMLAYILLEWPLGKLADNYWGEKEIMAIGFAVIACATAALSFITTPTTVLAFGAILFLSRVGAAFVDISTESYFFKQTSGADADTVSAFRILQPLSYIVGPVLGSAFLLFLPLSQVFLALGIFMLLGIPLAIFLRDTR